MLHACVSVTCGSFSSIAVNSGSGADTVNVEGTLRSTTINGNAGFDTVNVRGFSGELTVRNTYSYTALNVDFSSATREQLDLYEDQLDFGGKVINYTQADLSALNWAPSAPLRFRSLSETSAMASPRSEVRPMVMLVGALLVAIGLLSVLGGI